MGTQKNRLIETVLLSTQNIVKNDRSEIIYNFSLKIFGVSRFSLIHLKTLVRCSILHLIGLYAVCQCPFSWKSGILKVFFYTVTVQGCLVVIYFCH